MTMPPNWYDNPDWSASQRWWDGRQWTGHQRPQTSYLPTGKTAETLERKLRTGAFLPDLGKSFLNPLPARKKRRTKR